MLHTLRIYSRLAESHANGPGVRAVLWLAGCPFRCPGCFNKGMQDPQTGRDASTDDLVKWVLSIKGISGITLSGGEPTEQIPALIVLLKGLREKSDLSVILFSGRTKDEILSLPGGNTLLSLVDVLIDGRYDSHLSTPPGTWPSSSNQKIHLLTSRYTMTDFSDLPFHEVVITEDGEVMESGLFFQGS